MASQDASQLSGSELREDVPQLSGPKARETPNSQRAGPVFNSSIGNAKASGQAVIQSIATQFNITGNIGSDSADDNLYPWLMDVGHEKPEFFTGRREVLDSIHSVFWPPSTPDLAESQPHHSDRKKITISGPSGAGKTAVALEYAYTHRAKYYVVFLLDASTATELATGASHALRCIIEEYKTRWGKKLLPIESEISPRVASALRMFDDPVTDFGGLVKEATAGQQSAERFMAWLPSSLPWLLILDGYDDPAAFDVEGLMPKTAVGHVLITSRNPDPCKTDKQIAIQPSLGHSEAVKLLTKAAGQNASCCSELSGCEHAHQIVESVGCHPILIDLVGAYLRDTNKDLTFADYVEPPERVADSVSEVKDSYFARTFQKAFEGLSGPAKDLMQLCSLMDNTNIPKTLFKGGIGVVEWMTDNVALNNAMRKLRSSSLISNDLKTGNLLIHSLLHEYAGTTFNDEKRQQLSRWLVEMVTATFVFGEKRNADQWMYERRISPHINRCFEILETKLVPETGPLDPQIRKLAYQLAQAYSQLGDVEKAVMVYELGLRGVEPQSTVDLMVADMMNSYGIILHLQAELDDAEKQHAQAKQILENAPPSQLEEASRKRKLLEVEYHLATILVDQEKYTDAIKKLEEVLEAQQQQQAPGEISESTLKTQHQIGFALQQMGKLVEAKKAFELVYEVGERKLDDDNPTTLEAAHAIATVLEEMGEYDKALEQLEATLKKQEYLGKAHYSTLDTLHSISSLYECQARYDEAFQTNLEVVDKLKKMFGEAADKHPAMLVVRSGMADIQLRQSKYEEALKGYTSVCEDFMERDMISDAWRTRTNIARVLRDKGEYDAALVECEEALAALQEASNGDPDFVTAAEFCKATILELQGRYGEALELYHEVALKDEEQLGPNHVGTLKTKCFICSATAKHGEYDDALVLYEEIEAELSGLSESKRLSLELLVLHGMADVLEHQTTADKADTPEHLEQCQRATQLYDTILTKRKAKNLKDVEYYRALHGKGRVCIRMGENEEGKKLFLAAINGWKGMFGSWDHPLILMALEDRGKEILQRGVGLRQAHLLCLQALRGCEGKLRTGHPQTCRARMGLGAVLLKQDKLKEASEVYAASLQELQAEFGDDHPWTKEVRDIITGMGVGMEDSGAAEPVAVESVEPVAFKLLAAEPVVSRLPNESGHAGGVLRLLTIILLGILCSLVYSAIR